VDTWWQTETGGHLITPLPGATDLKPGSAAKPFFGVRPALVDSGGALLEGAGVLGAMAAGSLSDHFSRKNLLLILFVLSPLWVFLFTLAPVQLAYWVLPWVGFFSLSTTPVILTILQTRFPRNRALASGIFMSMGVLSRAVTTWALGFVADQFNLAVVFQICIVVSTLGILPLLLMSRPELERR